MAIDNQKIYNQIATFNSQPFDSRVSNSKSVVETYLYVDTDSAEDSSSFIEFLVKNKKVNFEKNNIIDLAFGSGNLTSHIVLDNIKDFEKIIFNDINKDVNVDLINEFDKKADFTRYNFYDPALWLSYENKADVVIFNPQVGGSYTDGDSKLEKKNIVIDSSPFEDYLTSNGVDTKDLTIVESQLKINVHSDTLNKVELGNKLKGLSIYNYKDIFYQSKTSKEKGVETNIVKFRATLNKILKPEGTVIFYGSDDMFNALFADFNTVFAYKRDSNNLYVAQKFVEERIVEEYRKDVKGDFVPFVEETNSTKLDGNLVEIQKELGVAIHELAKTTQVNDSLASELSSDSAISKSETFNIKLIKKGNLDFSYKNVLLKGVPGTGKSRLVDKKLLKELGLNDITSEVEPNNFEYDNILRINIHSASSNADLMQGIGLTTNAQNQIEYKEKQGLILSKLKQAIAHPNQPFAIILEEIQENSLNELIGDLIYLIEDGKRTNISELVANDTEFDSFESCIDELVVKNKAIHFVEIPYLVSNETKYRKLIIPNNLYFFCTSNYRDDKKVIEDNLLRRFTVIELYPKDEVIVEKEVGAFLKALNDGILNEFKNKEIHPDRFLIGHAYWINVNDEKSFCAALIKTITEFKDIREIEFSEISDMLKGLELPSNVDADLLSGANSYKEIIDKLQALAFEDILNSNV
jgi:5-methylcytosine-specific restriction protein B